MVIFYMVEQSGGRLGRRFFKSKFNSFYMAKSQAEKLADMIEANPNCQFDIDNDCWGMRKDENSDNDLTNSDKLAWSTDWYSHSSNYGAGIAEALIILLNRRGFNIKAEAV